MNVPRMAATVVSLLLLLPSASMACGAGSGMIDAILIPLFLGGCVTGIVVSGLQGALLASLGHPLLGRVAAVGTALALTSCAEPLFLVDYLPMLRWSVGLVGFGALIPWERWR